MELIRLYCVAVVVVFTDSIYSYSTLQVFLIPYLPYENQISCLHDRYEITLLEKAKCYLVTCMCQSYPGKHVGLWLLSVHLNVKTPLKQVIV